MVHALLFMLARCPEALTSSDRIFSRHIPDRNSEYARNSDFALPAQYKPNIFSFSFDAPKGPRCIPLAFAFRPRRVAYAAPGRRGAAARSPPRTGPPPPPSPTATQTRTYDDRCKTGVYAALTNLNIQCAANAYVAAASILQPRPSVLFEPTGCVRDGGPTLTSSSL